MRVALGIAYRGTAYHGWQSQPGGRTVQDQVERALAAFDATESYPPRPAAAGFQQSTHKMPLHSNESGGSSGPDTRDTPLAFDLSGISLDLDKPGETTARGIDTPFAEEDTRSDPLSRKLELAEEFQRIGDKDGARDLLREVLATASGTAKTKAQGMLDDLS